MQHILNIPRTCEIISTTNRSCTDSEYNADLGTFCVSAGFWADCPFTCLHGCEQKSIPRKTAVQGDCDGRGVARQCHSSEYAPAKCRACRRSRPSRVRQQAQCFKKEWQSGAGRFRVRTNIGRGEYSSSCYAPASRDHLPKSKIEKVSLSGVSDMSSPELPTSLWPLRFLLEQKGHTRGER